MWTYVAVAIAVVVALNLLIVFALVRLQPGSDEHPDDC
jgi:hypothetical protein